MDSKLDPNSKPTGPKVEKALSTPFPNVQATPKTKLTIKLPEKTPNQQLVVPNPGRMEEIKFK